MTYNKSSLKQKVITGSGCSMAGFGFFLLLKSGSFTKVPAKATKLIQLRYLKHTGSKDGICAAPEYPSHSSHIFVSFIQVYRVSFSPWEYMSSVQVRRNAWVRPLTFKSPSFHKSVPRQDCLCLGGIAFVSTIKHSNLLDFLVYSS